MSSFVQSLLLTLTVIFVYVWLNNPVLSHYSLQAFGMSVIIYFVIKRLTKSKLWHIAPTVMSLEMVVATFAFLILIGATGNTSSVLFPLGYIHLFFLVYATRGLTSAILTIEIMIFHFALSGNDLNQELATLITLPILTFFFIFSKNQYHDLLKEKELNRQEEQQLMGAEMKVEESQEFFGKFLPAKISQLKTLLNYPEANKNAILGQLSLIEIEIQKLIKKL